MTDAAEPLGQRYRDTLGTTFKTAEPHPSQTPEYWRRHFASKRMLVVPKERVSSRTTFSRGAGFVKIAEKWIRLWVETCPGEVMLWKNKNSKLRQLLEYEYGDLANMPKVRELCVAVDMPAFVILGIGRDPPQGVGDPQWHYTDPKDYERLCRLLPEGVFVKGSVNVR